VMMLSPETATCTATGGRFGNLIVQPDGFGVAFSTYVMRVLSPASFIARTFHFPATSASDREGTVFPPDAMVAGAPAAAAAPAAAESATARSDLRQPIRTA